MCLSFCLGSGLVVIPKSVNAKRIKENFESMNIFLDDNEMKQMKDIDKNFRIFKVMHVYVFVIKFNLMNVWCCIALASYLKDILT